MTYKEDMIAVTGLFTLAIISGLICFVGANYGMFWAIAIFIGVVMPLAFLTNLGMENADKNPQRKLTEWIK